MCLYLYRVLAMAAKRGPVMCCTTDRSAGPFPHHQKLTHWKPSNWQVPWRPWSSQTAKEPGEDKLEQSSQTEEPGDLTRISVSFKSCSISKSVEYSSEAAASDPPTTDPPLTATDSSASSQSSSGNLQNLSVAPSRPKISGGRVRGPR